MTEPNYREKAHKLIKQVMAAYHAADGFADVEDNITQELTDAHLAGRRDGIEAAERCGHRSEPEGISDEAARGYWDACEDILTDIRALLEGGKK